MTATAHRSFEHIESRRIDSLNVTLEHYRHRQTGADHFHIASDNPENVFMVALRTMPTDSTGVAHILEHTALCGSEKYPVRDPFFMMTRRSLNTFMNAMTSSDWTAYPFASENSQDYENLLSVYLDAVFYSNLNELDFRQEGHRLEFTEATDPSTPLIYKGVVFNEMKGAMSSPVSQLYQAIKHYLFPYNTYHYNSGGDPEAITDLSYEQLKSFYKTHYHPSNASFFTFGDRPAADIQERIHEQALHRFDALDHKLSVPLERRFNRILRVEDAYAAEGDDLSGKTHHVYGWLLGESTDLFAQLEAHLLSDVLLDNSASPLRQALENTDLGSNPSPMCGLEDSNREMMFVCGLEGSEPEKAAQFEQLIIDTLTDVANKGVPTEDVEAMLHQLELSQREVTGDGMPYGMQLIFSVVGAATHGGSVMDSLDIDPALARLRELAKDPDYIPSLIRRLLLDNVHRVRLTLRPDADLHQHQLDNERAKLDRIQQGLSEADQQAIIDQALALKARQEEEDDAGQLPKVTLADVKPDVKRIQPVADGAITRYQAGTNGLGYQQWYLPLPELTSDELALLPLYTALLTEVGAGDKDYLGMQQWQAARTGSVSVYSQFRSPLDSVDKVAGYLVLSGRALVRHFDELTQILTQHWTSPRFDEKNRIRDLLTQLSARREQSVTGQGHALAMQTAGSFHSYANGLTYDMSGLPAIRRLKGWLKAFKSDESAFDQWLARLSDLHAKLSDQRALAVLVGEPTELDGLAQLTERHGLAQRTESLSAPDQTAAINAAGQQLAWAVNTQVNFCSMAYPTVLPEHEDSAPLTVLAGVLRDNYLHRTIREQGGAYGGGASHDSNTGTFRFYSYRDPRIDGTLNDFRASIDWVRDTGATADQVESAILGVVSSMDKPGSPAGEAKQAFLNRLFGRTDTFRKAYREALLSVTPADIANVAERYFDAERASAAVVTDKEHADALTEQGFSIETL
ncbi:peptidase M16 [Saccharospirillum sp. MSK14-1]|uniref:insulinase family protein n=1 Tax=Saccharospirillum sp. MSK14-1 TaxID=1897632 RepID=UPI000D374A78|nr:insulinase family protein [Saccharospirillum sp. MSK14-1]PTY36581.1 peptidase M16 [Saccharospirillum sp. MSK14-1]